MKKILFLTLFFLSGCSTTLLPLPETIQNPKCEDYAGFEVSQVLDDFILARACTGYSSYSHYCEYEHFVYISKKKNEIYYDEQKIKIPEEMCPSFYGTHTYRLLSGMDRTVPKMKFITRNIQNPEYKTDKNNK